MTASLPKRLLHAPALPSGVVPLLLLILPVVCTLAGGVLALRFRHDLTLLTAVSAGLLLGAIFLDLLPEAVHIGASDRLSSSVVLGLAVLSFLLFFGLDALFAALDRHLRHGGSGKVLLRRAGAGMLIFHSFRDGMAIGAAYAVAHPAGYAVGFGIAAHDLGDGLNTVLLSTGGEPPTWIDLLFLAADALAPLLGGLLTVWWTPSARGSVVLLVLAAGFFLQMVVSRFLPGLRDGTTSRSLLLAAVLFGALFIYGANLLIDPAH